MLVLEVGKLDRRRNSWEGEEGRSGSNIIAVSAPHSSLGATLGPGTNHSPALGRLTNQRRGSGGRCGAAEWLESVNCRPRSSEELASRDTLSCSNFSEHFVRRFSETVQRKASLEFYLR